MALRIARRLSIVLIAATAGACSTAPSRYYTLDSTATAEGAPPLHAAVLVGPVTVPAAVDQPQFVVQVASNRVELDEFNRWAAPLGDSIERVVAGDLAVQLGSPDVATAPMAGFAPAYAVAINVQRFDSKRGEGTLLDAVWAIRRIAGGATRFGPHSCARVRTGRRLRLTRRSAQPGTRRMSADIASAIRALAAIRQ